MILSDILFSPHARVWNLRLLLLETIGVAAFLGATLSPDLQALSCGETVCYLPWYLLFPTFGFILLHHLGFIIDWPIPGLALIDLIMIFIEACGIAAGFFFTTFGIWQIEGVFPTIFKFACIPLGLSLTLSMIFRVATIIRSNGRFFRQRFVFLGGCTGTNPAYTSTAILLNRSVARPLVRGESVIVIIARALILSCIGVGVPVFGIYAMIISPLHASISTRTVTTFAAGDLGFPPGNVTFDMGYFNFAFDETSDSDFSVNRVSVGQDNCSVTFVDSYIDRLVECPFTWASVAGPSALKPISI
ncbi:hypothetical protein K438DRAFT_1879236 [Mycena galopus ATCC 62051]|nr:hypothetical protein K438DRAFT_1879236 [Mycena galopus ATCC 62051]